MGGKVKDGSKEKNRGVELNVLIFILIIGISFAQIPMSINQYPPAIDIWQAQGLFITWIASLLFLVAFVVNPKNKPRRNIPLMCFCFWIFMKSFFHLYFWMKNMNHIMLWNLLTVKEIPNEAIRFVILKCIEGVKQVIQMSVVVNLTVILVIYRTITQYLSKNDIVLSLKFMRGVVLAMMFMCILQKFNLSQIYRLADTQSNWHNNIVTGFIGNGTHLSGLLAMCLPLFLWKNSREDILAMILMFILLFSCGTTMNDPSISGFIITMVILLNFYKTKWWIKTLVFIGMIVSLFSVYYLPYQFFNDNGRLSEFKVLWDELFLKAPLVGHGASSFQLYMMQSTNVILKVMSHVHLEYYQIAIEFGIVGLVLFVWMIQDFFNRKANDRLALVLKSIVLGYLVSGLFNFPFHLWLPSTFVLIAYGGYECLDS